MRGWKTEPALGPPPGLRPAHLLSHLLGLPSLNTRRGREDGWALLFTVTVTVTAGALCSYRVPDSPKHVSVAALHSPEDGRGMAMMALSLLM